MKSGGTKFDSEKPDFSLIDAEWLEEVAKVMSFGKVKYSANNWRKGIAISRILSAGLRHLWAVVRGEDNDAETGLSHLAHLSCCAMFAHWTLKYKPNLDDRYKHEPHYRTGPYDTGWIDRSGVGLGEQVVPTEFDYDTDNSLFPPPKDI